MMSSFADLLPTTDDEQELLLRQRLDGPEGEDRADAALRLGATHRKTKPQAARRLLAVALQGGGLTKAKALLRLAYVAHQEDQDDPQAREYLAEAREITRRFAEDAPDDVELIALRIDIATAFALLRQVQDATALLWLLDDQVRTLHAENESREDTWREMSASINLRLGQLLSESDARAATDALRHAVAWGSGTIEAAAALQRGWLLERVNGPAPETEEQYRHATDLKDPIVAPQAHLSLGDALWRAGRPDKAHDEWMRAKQYGDAAIGRDVDERLDERWRDGDGRRAPVPEATNRLRPVPGVRPPTALGRIASRRAPDDAGQPHRRVIVVGAGTGGHYLLPSLRHGYRVLGFVDDNPRVSDVYGEPILGTIDDLERLIQSEEVDQIVFAIPTAPGSTRNRALDAAHRCGVDLVTLPSMFELRFGHPLVPQLRPLEVSETFGDFAWHVDREAAAMVRGRRVAITGAGSELGTALARRVAHGHARHLLLLDDTPRLLMRITTELQAHRDFRDAEARVVDCSDKAEVAAAFADVPPEVVFHCAGVHHVPMPSLRPWKAFRANTLSARVVAEAAREVGARDLVLASIDRAAHRASAFDWTRALAEAAVLELAVRETHRPRHLQLAGGSDFRVSVLRLPNIWERDAGVVGRFTDQLRDGGPIYADAPTQRKFVPAWDAAQTLLRTYGRDHEGGLFAYMRGEVLGLRDIADRLVKIHGLVPNRDIRIVPPRYRDSKAGVHVIGDGERAEGNGDIVRVSQSEPLQAELRARLAALLDRVGHVSLAERELALTGSSASLQSKTSVS